jgi:hypothetical protein
MWYSNRFKFIEAQKQKSISDVMWATVEENRNLNYEYFSKFPDFDPSDPDSFKIGYWDVGGAKTSRMIKLDDQRFKETLEKPQDYSSQKKFAEELYYQLLRQGGTPFAAVQKALEAVFNKFDNTFSPRQKLWGLNGIKNHLSQLATNESREINKNLQQENILRDQLYRQGLEVIKNLKGKGMTNEQIESQMSSKLNNLFKQGQISQKVNSELNNFFVMKINSLN